MEEESAARDKTKAASPAERRLAAALGAPVADLGLVGEAFAAALRAQRLDGAAIFERLRAGRPLAEALALPRALVDVLYARAHSWFAIGGAQKAGAIFALLCALADDVADHWVGYALCLKGCGRFAEAERALARAARLRPAWAAPHFHRAEILVRSGDWARAARALSDFDARVEAATPPGLRREAARIRQAIALRASDCR